MKLKKQRSFQHLGRLATPYRHSSTVLTTCALFLLFAPQLRSLGYSEATGARYFGIHTLEISSRTLSLHFEGDPEASHITVEGVDLTTRYRIESERDGGVLRIRVVGDDSPAASLDRARVELKVPPHLRIIAETTYGDISVRGVRSGPLQLVSGTGAVHVIDSAGDLMLRTNSGQLLMENVGGEAALTAGQGEITVHGFEGELTAHTTLGPQRYSQVRGGLSISTNSGDLTIENSEAQLRMTSTHGSIRAVGVVLNGPSEARSLAGNMTVLLRNPSTDLLLDLHAGAIGRILLNGSELGSGVQPFAEDTADTEDTSNTAALLTFNVHVGSGVLNLYTDGLEPETEGAVPNGVQDTSSNGADG
ncbi:MAG: DUF4097 domain-containing protein [Spirochaeta sp.]|nr:DUF4097 domain-containing protein [Spirochaeta sp.]